VEAVIVDANLHARRLEGAFLEPPSGMSPTTWRHVSKRLALERRTFIMSMSKSISR